MTRSRDTSDLGQVVQFRGPVDKADDEHRQYLLGELEELREQVERGEIRSFAVAVEREDFGIYTNFTGGFNPVLIGGVSQLLHRLNHVE